MSTPAKTKTETGKPAVIIKCALWIVIALLAVRLSLNLRTVSKRAAPAAPENSILNQFGESLRKGEKEQISRLVDKIDIKKEMGDGSRLWWDYVSYVRSLRIRPASSVTSDHPLSTPEAKTDDHGDILRLLLKKGADPNAKTHYGSPLLVAFGDSERVKILLNAGANAAARSSKEENALFSAIHDVGCLKLLLGAGADIHAKGYGGTTPLMFALNFSQRREVLELLLDRGARLEDKNDEGATPLLLAAQTCDLPTFCRHFNGCCLAAQIFMHTTNMAAQP